MVDTTDRGARLLPAVAPGSSKEAVRFGNRALRYDELAAVAAGVDDKIGSCERVAIWATPELETCVAVVGALAAGVPAVMINPGSGVRELAHVIRDSSPSAVFAAPGAALPTTVGDVPRVEIDLDAASDLSPDEPSAEAPALIVYTSGTTGPPKGVVIPRRAIASNLDALARAWGWTADDVLVHGLPLFHVHGLVLGLLGPLRLGGSLRHLGRFDPREAASQLADGGTMLFGVPTMYHRLAAEAEADVEVARAVGGARLLVSGSAALPTKDHERIARATGMRIVERYGMTETLMNCAVRSDGDRRPGTVGPPVDGVEVRIVDEDETTLEISDGETVGEVQVRGPNLFLEYLNRPDATAQTMTDEGWFRTGDVGVRDPDGYLRILGRRSTDLIKSGGFKIGAGEIEAALVDHPAVREAAVTGEPDDDLGERVVAWIAPSSPEAPPSAKELIDHVARLLSPYKRPRVVRFVDSLPRNELGKIQKNRLGG